MGKYAILIVSALIFSVITYSHGLKNALMISNTRTVQSFSENQAHNIAQSAVMAAVYDLRNTDNSSLTGIVENLEVGGSQYYPSINNFETWPELEGEYNLLFKKTIQMGQEMLEIESTGRFEETEYTTILGLNLNATSSWNPDIFQSLHANENLDISSANGGNICGDVTFNGDYLHLGNNNTQEAKIDGDLLLAEGDDVTIDGREVHVSGDISDGDELEYDMPEFPHEEYDIAKQNRGIEPNLILNGGSHSINATDNLKYIDEISLSGNSTLTINTGSEPGKVSKLFVGVMDVQASDIIIEGEGKLELYVESEFDIGGNAEFNKEGDVNDVYLFYRGNHEIDLVGDEIEEYEGEIKISGTTQYNGSLFAYNADLVLNGTAGITGDIITGGGSVTIHGNPELESDISRLIYAPNARVVTSGNPKMYGSIISNSFSGGGSFTLCYDGEFGTDGFDLVVLDNYGIVFWN